MDQLSELKVDRRQYKTKTYFEHSEIGPVKKRRLGLDVEEMESVYTEVEVEKVPEHIVVVAGSEVRKAKPSPLPSSTSWGSISEVPFLPGILFPYFEGMIKPDVTFVRNMVSTHFFRNLPMNDKMSVHSTYKTFKGEINTYVHTPAGLILSHVLYGVNLCMDSQTQLYLLFDDEKYLGFCLLGGMFQVYDGAKWVMPIEADKLREELSGLSTHHGNLMKLASMLSEIKLLDSTKAEVVAGSIDTSYKLATVLGARSYEKTEEKDEEAEVVKLLRELSFPTSFRPVNLVNLQWALHALCDTERTDLTGEKIHIPFSNLPLLANYEYLIFCCFGPRSPNFYSASGTEYVVPPMSEHDNQSDLVVVKKGGDETEERKQKRMPVIVVGVTTPQESLRKWGIVKRKRAIKFDPRERAKAARCHAFTDGRDALWKSIRETIGTLEKVVKISSKETAEEVMEVDGDEPLATVDDFF
jgi:hypothetical protein